MSFEPVPFWKRDWFVRVSTRVSNVLSWVTPRGLWPVAPSMTSTMPLPVTGRRAVHFLAGAHPEAGIGCDTRRAIYMGALGMFARFWIEVLNDITIYDQHKLRQWVYYNRQPGQGLITVANHNSELDEPCITAALCGTGLLLEPRYMRWVFCAQDVCFANAAASAFFSNGKALPVRRGGGVDQPELQQAVAKLNEGEWIHIFPEGRVYQNQDGVMGPVRAGIGRLVYEAKIPPVLLPFYAVGMEKVRPIDQPPKTGQKVHVIVGDPIRVEDILEKHRRLGSAPIVVYREVARRIGVELAKLHLELKDRMSESKRPSESERLDTDDM